MAQERVLAVIPARFASTRLPGKPLAMIAGKTLIQRVWEGAVEAKRVSRVVIATDDERIAQVVQGFRGEVMMSPAELTTGSERVAWVAQRLEAESALNRYEGIVNIQGDMPFISGTVVDVVVDLLTTSGGRFDVTTVAIPIRREETFLSPTTAKVVIGSDGRALYFSRAAIPFVRNRSVRDEYFGYQHLGLYVFSKSALEFFVKTKPSPLEQREELEQLRLLEHGMNIGVRVLDDANEHLGAEVNTPEDLQRANVIATRQ